MPESTRNEYLKFLAVGAHPAIVLNTLGWNAWDYAGFYDAPDAVGENRPIPGLAGRLAMAWELDEGDLLIPVDVWGGYFGDGSAHADERAGVRTNLRYLRNHLLLPPGTSNGARPVEFHRWDGDVETGDVQVKPPAAIAFESPVQATLVLRVTIPDGMLS